MNGRPVRREASIQAAMVRARVTTVDRPKRAASPASRFLLPLALLGGLTVGACTSSRPTLPSIATEGRDASAPPAASLAAAPPAWFALRMTDVQTGRDFAIGDFAGRVVLIEAMAEWCPTCVEQQREVQAFRAGLANPDDVVSVSLDIDVHEDAASLKHYAAALHHDWHYAVAPLEVARALGNLYSAEYLNPPYSPMLLIDRHGAAIQLPYGVKNADYLRTTLEPYLAP